MRKKQSPNSQLLYALHQRAEYFAKIGHFATAQNYRSAAHSFERYLSSRNLMDASFSDLTVRDYTQYLTLERMVRRNSLSFYMRFLRAAWVQMGGSTELFAQAFTSVAPTRKRALSATTLLQLENLQLTGRPAMWRDMFLFSFAARGMAFVDMATLKKNDITDGYIFYRRHKTGTPLSIRMEPCMSNIVNRWTSHDTIYVFPIIKSQGERAFQEYQSGLSAYNKALRSMALKTGLTSLSSYTARHTWATSAYNAGIPVSVISEGMGHSTEKVTRIYLNQMDNTIIDRANQTLLQTLGL